MQAALLTLSLSIVCQEPDPELAKIWPQNVTMPPGMRLYEKSRFAQSVYILNGNDTHEWVHSNAPRQQPDFFPWTTSGGLDMATGWTSKAAIAIPQGTRIVVWVEYIDGMARRPLPKYRWRYPRGTVLADMLFNGGVLFELRTITSLGEDVWQFKRVYTNESNFPAGYKGKDADGKFPIRNGRRMSCIDCHQYAGAWSSYGSNIPGSGGVFSFNPFKEARSVLKADWPVRFYWDGNEAIASPPGYWVNKSFEERAKYQKN